jgi:hypothetical protein
MTFFKALEELSKSFFQKIQEKHTSEEQQFKFVMTPNIKEGSYEDEYRLLKAVVIKAKFVGFPFCNNTVKDIEWYMLFQSKDMESRNEKPEKYKISDFTATGILTLFLKDYDWKIEIFRSHETLEKI